MSVDTAGMLEHHVRDSFCSLGCHGQMDHELVFGGKNHRENSSAKYARSVQGASVNIRNSGCVASVLRVFREAQGRHRIEMAIRLQQHRFDIFRKSSSGLHSTTMLQTGTNFSYWMEQVGLGGYGKRCPEIMQRRFSVWTVSELLYRTCEIVHEEPTRSY
jgi:hypothetical protein